VPFRVPKLRAASRGVKPGAKPAARPPAPVRLRSRRLSRVGRLIVRLGVAGAVTAIVFAGGWVYQTYGLDNLVAGLKNSGGLIAYRLGQFERAAPLFRGAAQQGEPHAQNNLAVLYDRGLGVRQDRTYAQKLYQQAAAKGIAAASYNLGRLLQRGLPADKRDPAKALAAYEKAARAGDPFARVAMAYLVPENDLAAGSRAAEEWMKAAAAQGLADAQLALGRLQRGRAGAPQEHDARAWLRKAAEGGNAAAAFLLAVEDRSLDPQAARHWLTVAAEGGVATAAYRLARHYAPANGIPLDAEKAVHWFTRAAAQAPQAAGKPERTPPFSVPALRAYWYPVSRPIDVNAAALASLAVAHLYADGLGVPQDFAKAAEFYRRAADLGMAEAAYHLANHYRDGRGVPRDREAAFRWYRRAAELGDTVAELLARDMMPMDRPAPQIARARQRPKIARLGPNGERYELDEFDLVVSAPDGARTLLTNWVNGEGGIVIEDVVDDDGARPAVHMQPAPPASRAAPAKQSARQ
jgi:TPR repeat protein